MGQLSTSISYREKKNNIIDCILRFLRDPSLHKKTDPRKLYVHDTGYINSRGSVQSSFFIDHLFRSFRSPSDVLLQGFWMISKRLVFLCCFSLVTIFHRSLFEMIDSGLEQFGVQNIRDVLVQSVDHSLRMCHLAEDLAAWAGDPFDVIG